MTTQCYPHYLYNKTKYQTKFNDALSDHIIYWSELYDKYMEISKGEVNVMNIQFVMSKV